MFTSRLFRASCLGGLLQVLAGELALVAVTALVFRLVSGLRGIPMSDGLFVVGVVELLIAGVGMRSSPFGAAGGPWRRDPPMPAPPTPRDQTPGDLLVEQSSLALRLVASGLLTLLVSTLLAALGY